MKTWLVLILVVITLSGKRPIFWTQGKTSRRPPTTILGFAWQHPGNESEARGVTTISNESKTVSSCLSRSDMKYEMAFLAVESPKIFDRKWWVC